MSDKAYEIIEVAKKTGALKRGTNEVTKAIERGKAAFIAYASDVSPKELTMHLPILCKEKGVACMEVPSREELGTAAGLSVSAVAIAVVDAGDAKKLIAEVAKEAKAAAAPAKEEAPKEETKEAPKEEAKEEVKEEAKEAKAE